MKKLAVMICLACMTLSVMAQPAKRRTTTSTAAAKAGAQAGSRTTSSSTSSTSPSADRAALLFPTADAMPEDVAWRRDIYRQLDLKQKENAALYYPVEPIGQQMNLFTCLFKLVLNGRITAYRYNLDGNESFADSNKLNLMDFLNDQSIYYEMKNGRPTVADADVPSRQVLRYYLKESSYLDQRTGTTHTKVVALCPILLDGYSDDFAISSDEDDEFAVSAESMVTSKPLFWVRYDDVAPFLSKLPVMASDLNNVSNMTAEDYFALNRYAGKIYKTNNMQGQTLKDYCKTDSAMTREQNRIEQELRDFEEHLWGHVQKNDSADAATDVAKADTKKQKREKTTTPSESASRRSSSKKESSAAPSSSSTPRVSARRQRR